MEQSMAKQPAAFLKAMGVCDEGCGGTVAAESFCHKEVKLQKDSDESRAAHAA
jgi:hypothetical protein